MVSARLTARSLVGAATGRELIVIACLNGDATFPPRGNAPEEVEIRGCRLRPCVRESARDTIFALGHVRAARVGSAETKGNSRDGHLPSQLDSQLTCRLVRGLTKEQKHICLEAPDVAVVAFQGMQMAVKECQHQFRWHRWNCSSLVSKSTNPHSSAIMKRELHSHGYVIITYIMFYTNSGFDKRLFPNPDFVFDPNIVLDSDPIFACYVVR
ncbi:Protein Wnt-10a [Eumeta japonica]|uniref:Protein Wnt n=1 Tax=Eumeta variegata TaxID=151549 RepID=A0A4C1V4B5_EUMVA|nr:Protein Wnt-10a [Eumeta japonica]